ncbi:outer membrane protein [Phyllobacterium sp. YR620]|uniref:TolC family outer membrane protein n=1 Tax=unclassified Phyllobacterium TaxID=2638441 RepID=UPI0008904DC6|nr:MULTISPECIES: TolC family outer membrane protein [unclassified Phyllobacterium]MRG57286.1 TolC family outer membrane protein [Phyllobacterium sp. SYP-B3895]SDP06989.1 outer membrane protein [Phyllobacterium sp. YR620]
MKGLMVFKAGKRVLTAALLSATVLATTPSMAETIFGAMAKAYNNNASLNADRAGVRVTDEGVAVAKSGYRPIVSATADLTSTNRRLDGGPSGTSNVGTFGVSVNQVLFDGFTVSNNIKAAKTQVLAARENLRNNEQNLLFSAAQAYMNVYLTRQIVILRQKNLEFLDEQLRAAKARFDVGEGTRTDVAQAEASKASAIATLDAAKSDEKTAEATYIQIVGDAPGRLAAAAMATKAVPKSMDQAFSIATNNHPAILSTQYAVDSAGYNVKANEGQLLPQIGLNGTIQRDEIFSGGISSGTTDGTSASAGIQVTIPIYNGGRTSALVRQSKETLGQRRIEVDVARDSVRQAIAQAYSQMESAKAQIVAQRSVVAAAQLALNGVIEERKVGQRTTLDVLNAQADVLTGQINLAQAERDSVVTSYAVLSAVGRLTAMQIGLQVAEYKPEEHYDAVKDKWIGLRTPDGR